ncbi:MAG TPA: hypothetical protein VFH25_10430 [Nitrososphaeraceae archaeon]|nr:hypothetical protein [Nitrososphaeraceae archaeon]
MKFYFKSMMKASASISTRTSGVIRRLASTRVVIGRIFERTLNAPFLLLANSQYL